MMRTGFPMQFNVKLQRMELHHAENSQFRMPDTDINTGPNMEFFSRKYISPLNIGSFAQTMQFEIE